MVPVDDPDDTQTAPPRRWSLDPDPPPPAPPLGDDGFRRPAEPPPPTPAPPLGGYDRPPTWGDTARFPPPPPPITKDADPAAGPGRRGWLAVAVIAALVGGVVGAATYGAVD